MKKHLSLILGALLLSGCNLINASSSTGLNTSSNSQVVSSSNKQESIDSSNNSSESTIQKEKGFIYDEGDLMNIKNDLTGTYFLANDINLTKEWTPIGDDENPFKGVLEGNGFKISNLTITKSLSITLKTTSSIANYISAGGLFGKVSGTIKNLTVENVKVNLQDQNLNKNVSTLNTEYKIFVGGIAGINKGTIINCSSKNVSINVNSTHLVARGRLGGLVGKNEGTIEKSNSSGTITSTFYYENVRAGGLVGAVEGGAIKTSYSSVSLNINNKNDKSIVGGLVGIVQFSTIENCYATGNVEANSKRAATAGGIAGLVDATIEGTSEIKNCYSSSKITTNASERSSYSGGIVGNCELLISGNKLVGNVTISNCFYVGEGVYSTAINKAHAGLIISCIEGNTSQLTITLKNCCYLADLKVYLGGKTDNKENTQGEKVSTIKDIYSKITLDNNVWEYDANTDQLPILK